MSREEYRRAAVNKAETRDPIYDDIQRKGCISKEPLDDDILRQCFNIKDPIYDDIQRKGCISKEPLDNDILSQRFNIKVLGYLKKLWSFKVPFPVFVVALTVLLSVIIILVVIKDGFLPENLSNSLRGSEHLSHVLSKMEEIKVQLCENSTAGCRLCPYGWLRHEDNCYYYSNDKTAARTWNESRKECSKLGAHLLVILGLDQRKVIESWLKQRTSEGRFWIGLQRDGDGWRWVTGHRYDSSLVQISGGSSNLCAFLYSGTYYPEDCKVPRQWICQKDAVKIDLHTAQQ